MKFLLGIIVYLFICGFVAGSAINTRYERCGHVTPQEVEDFLLYSTIFPLAVSAAFIIDDGVLGESQCDTQ